MRVFVTGSTGLIGSALVPRLEQLGHSATRIVRSAPRAGEISWDPMGGRLEPADLAGADAVVHLAGEGVGERRWTDEQKARIRDSRVRGTDLLARTLAQLERKPAVLVSGSAIGYYGDRGDETLNEESAGGDGFLADVVRDWEAATAPAEEAGIRVVHLRSGIVLSRRGGALGRMLTPFRLGVGGRLGSGRQYMSWITLDDEVAAIVHALTTDAVRGAMNATAPNPVTNAEFSKVLGRVLRRPSVVPVPRFALSLVLGSELAGELLGSQRVLPAKLTATGFEFRHPDLEPALRSVV
jgi:uncharacterized protein